jgi:phage-related protein
MANFIIDVGIPPDRGQKIDAQPRVLKASYGDGYEQRVAEGINNIPESWNLTWKNRTLTEGNKIVSFLENTKGVTSFDWYPEGYRINSTTTGAASMELIDTTQYFTDLYRGGTVLDSASNSAIVVSISSRSTLVLDQDIMSSSEEYNITPGLRKYVCDKWSNTSVVNGVQTVTATFRKVFEP